MPTGTNPIVTSGGGSVSAKVVLHDPQSALIRVAEAMRDNVNLQQPRVEGDEVRASIRARFARQVGSAHALVETQPDSAEIHLTVKIPFGVLGLSDTKAEKILRDLLISLKEQ